MAGRRTTKNSAERREDLLAAVKRSGFTGVEVIQILFEWYGWWKLEITGKYSGVMHVFEQGDLHKEY